MGHGDSAGRSQRAARPADPPPAAVAAGAGEHAAHAIRGLAQGGNDYIGKSAPNAVDSPLMKAIGTDNVVGKTLEDEHIQIYGWINPGGNVSTAKTGYNGNFPAAYAFTPNIVQLDQAVVYVERVPDTVQMDHIDWGFRISGIYGETYRYTTAYGLFSNQLLYGNHFPATTCRWSGAKCISPMWRKGWSSVSGATSRCRTPRRSSRRTIICTRTR